MKKLSAAKIAAKKRSEKILRLYDRLRPDYEQAATLYWEIANKVGCSYPTVIRALQANGRIHKTTTAE